ncbi:MAG: extracellular solute-binding protein [Chloroflexi bacterium]|nr:extracellular solute-binding protein [Chloroflexota bacterium]
MKHLIGLILVTLAAIPVVMACAGPVGPAPDTAPAAAARPAAPGRGEWDSLVEAAKKEGTAAVYVGSIGESRDVSSKVFWERYGVALEYVPGRGAEHVQRITRERGAGLYRVDAMLMGETTFFNSISPMKITVPLEPMLVLPEVTDASKWRPGKLLFIDKDKTAIVFGLNRQPYVAINTDMVKEGEIVSNEDVLNPKWKGKIVLNDPTVAGNGAEAFAFLMLKAFGKEKGRQYMERLLQQEPVISRDLRLQVEWVARGRYAIGLWVETSGTLKMASEGAPIKLLAMKEGQPVSAGPMVLMLFDKAPHPNAAKLFANWILGQEGGTVMSKYSGWISARLDVSTAEFNPVFVPEPGDMPYPEEYKLQTGELLQVAGQIFKDLLK